MNVLIINNVATCTTPRVPSILKTKVFELFPQLYMTTTLFTNESTRIHSELRVISWIIFNFAWVWIDVSIFGLAAMYSYFELSKVIGLSLTMLHRTSFRWACISVKKYGNLRIWSIASVMRKLIKKIHNIVVYQTNKPYPTKFKLKLK